jgi:hypothetical protein
MNLTKSFISQDTAKKIVAIAFSIFIIIIIVSTVGNKKETGETISSPEQPPLTSQQIQEQEYIQSAQKINSDVGEAARYLANIFQTKPISLSWTEQEIIEVAMYTVVIEESYRSAKELIPPEKFQTHYSYFLAGLSKYAEAMPFLRSGIDNLDNDQISQSIELILEGAEFINQATKELNKLIPS